MFPSRRIVTSGGDVFRDEYSLSFDGSNANIRIPEVEYDVDGSTVSFVFWGKRAAVDTTLTVLGHTSETSLKLIRFNSANQLKITTDTVGDTGTITQNINDTEWHHYVVIASSGAITAYQDGVACSVSGNVGDNNLTINTIAGQGTNGTDNEFNGNISEIAVYNIALTSAQAKQIYNGREPFNHKDWSKSGNLTQWWRFGDGRLDRFDSNGLIGDEVAPTIASDLITDGNFPDGDNWSENSWTIGSNKASLDGSQGGAVNLIQTGLSTIEGETVKVVFEITDYTAGNVVLKVGGNPYTDSGSFNSVGVHTFYAVVTGDTGYLIIQGDDTFNGSVSNVTLQILGGSAGTMLNMAATDFTGDTP